MPLIRAVPPDPSDALAAHARALFILYGDFLRSTLPANTFNFRRFQRETATLPLGYSEYNGEVLLAFEGGTPAACIAYRAALTGPVGFTPYPIPDPTGRTGEIKRLFVADAFRGRGLARLLTSEAIARLAARRFTRIVLDTDHVHMPAALALYRSFSFVEYAAPEGSITFFHRIL